MPSTKGVRKMKVEITDKNVTNGFVIRALDGEHKDEYVAQREGKFTIDVLWARVFRTKQKAESYCRECGWDFS